MIKFGSVLFLFFCIGSPLFSQCTVSNNTINASSNTVCSGTGTTINGSLPSGADSYAYSWLVSSTNATTGFTPSVSSQDLPTGNLTANRWYKRIVTGTCTSPAGSDVDTSAVIAISVVQPPAATITPQGSTTFCAPGSVDLNANTGTGLSYKWKLN